ncbi:hypothetical protein IFM89_038781 [Coptis chinensis]|uniref:Uncharacterized protein n=1 Tax=Coptis chinensis TaxID=261450 RepID=A0A835IYZ9_9MAGN|nr:hypothetical protein IFM89_038781 [Coptis chinensis]
MEYETIYNNGVVFRPDFFQGNYLNPNLPIFRDGFSFNQQCMLKRIVQVAQHPDSSHLHGPQKWNEQEDGLLDILVNIYGDKDWANIAKGMNGRTGKQCRERWYNHAKPAIEFGPWSENEDIALVRGHMKFKNRWVEIAKLIPGRTENMVKNRWNNISRKENSTTRKNRTSNRSSPPSEILRDYIRSVESHSNGNTVDAGTALMGNIAVDLPSPSADDGQVIYPSFPDLDTQDDMSFLDDEEMFHFLSQGNSENVVPLDVALSSPIYMMH